MTETTIHLATPEDAADVAALIRALDLHYGGPGAAPTLEDAKAVAERSMRAAEGTRYALASRNGHVVGLACFALLRPGDRLRGLLFLKELFVVEEARGQAVGAAILAWLAGYARARGIARIDLTTDAANMDARAFYERLGGVRQDKVFYRFSLEGADAAAPPQE